MAVKAMYNDLRKQIIHHLIINKDIQKIKGILHDKEIYKKYSKEWQAVNLDEYIKKFDIKSDIYNPEHNFRKITFYSGNKEYAIIAAIGGKYFRVQEIKEDGRGGKYVGLDLKEPSISGKFKKEARRAQRHRLTHFKMSYKKGTV